MARASTSKPWWKRQWNTLDCKHEVGGGKEIGDTAYCPTCDEEREVVRRDRWNW